MLWGFKRIPAGEEGILHSGSHIRSAPTGKLNLSEYLAFKSHGINATLRHFNFNVGVSIENPNIIIRTSYIASVDFLAFFRLQAEEFTAAFFHYTNFVYHIFILFVLCFFSLCFYLLLKLED